MDKNLFSKAADGISSVISGLVNRRSAVAQNEIVSRRLTNRTLAAMVNNGLYGRIVDLKAGHATKSGFNFEDSASQEFYKTRVEVHLKKAVRSMITYGRGVIVVVSRGEPLSAPLTSNKNIEFRSFSADLITAYTAVIDLIHPRFFKPEHYQIREHQVHHSRVFDFTYIEPPDSDKPIYHYGGISEGERIYPQLIADGVIERAVPAILEKSSTLFYKVTGFKDALQQRREKELIDFFGALEDARSIYGAGILDAEDDVTVMQQSLTNLDQSDLITLKRIAMVSAIPLTVLLGEGRTGLAGGTDHEREVFNEMVLSLQNEYVLGPLTALMRFMGHQPPQIYTSQNISARDKLEYEKTVIENAKNLYELGEDHQTYLNAKGVITTEVDYAEEPIEGEGIGVEPETEAEQMVRMGLPVNPINPDASSALYNE